MRANDAVVGLVLILFAVAMFAVTLSFPAFPGQNYGPSLFPRILASGIAIGGLLLVGRGLIARRAGADWLTMDPWTREPHLVINFVGVLAALVFYIFAAETLGFIPTAFVILAGLIWRLGSRPPIALLVAAGTTVVIQWFFGGIMRVPLPRGIFGITF